MSHLVRGFVAHKDQYITLAACQQAVQDAHAYLVAHGMAALTQTNAICDVRGWGSAVKRAYVQLPEPRPDWVTPTGYQHSLAEVYNQCATMERLLDVLEWAQSDMSDFQNYRVVRCHPTTSSMQVVRTKDAMDNDLVLISPDRQLARFEISDVASGQDSNRKEEKDLVSLGVLPDNKHAGARPHPWPNECVFLVVSSEFADRLLHSKKRRLQGRPHYFAYEPVLGVADRTTRILKVVRREP